jgi:hypothetical protein
MLARGAAGGERTVETPTPTETWRRTDGLNISNEPSAPRTPTTLDPTCGVGMPMSAYARYRALIRGWALATVTLLSILVVGALVNSPAADAIEWTSGWSSGIIDAKAGWSLASITREEQQEYYAGLVGLNSLSCASPRFCMAVGGTLERRGNGPKLKEYERGYVVPFNGHVWGRPLRVSGELELSSVSCTSPSFCAAVGNRVTGWGTFAGYSLIYNGHSWSKPALRVKGPTERGYRDAELEKVSCASPKFCAVSNNTGEVLVYNGRSWSEPVKSYPKGRLVGMVCPAISRCIAAVDVFSQEVASFTIAEGGTSHMAVPPFQEAFALTFNGNAWSVPTVLPVDVGSLACPTASFCLAFGGAAKGGEAHSFAVTFNGHTWSPEQVSSIVGASLSSCASQSFCVVGGTFSMLTFSEGLWSAPEPLPVATGKDLFVALSCPSASFCLALSASGQARYHLTSPRPPPVPSERRSTLYVRPTSVRPGGSVRVFGLVPSRYGQLIPCPAGEQVELFSKAFRHGRFGRGAILYGQVAFPDGSFSVHTKISAHMRAGTYTVEARCGGEEAVGIDIGATRLRVLTSSQKAK